MPPEDLGRLADEREKTSSGLGVFWYVCPCSILHYASHSGLRSTGSCPKPWGNGCQLPDFFPTTAVPDFPEISFTPPYIVSQVWLQRLSATSRDRFQDGNNLPFETLSLFIPITNEATGVRQMRTLTQVTLMVGRSPGPPGF